MTGNVETTVLANRVLYNHFRKVILLKLLHALRPEVYEAALKSFEKTFPHYPD